VQKLRHGAYARIAGGLAFITDDIGGGEQAAHSAPMTIHRLFAGILGALMCVTARAADPGLVVAGRGTSLEQAIAAPHGANYRLLVRRNELERMRASRAEHEVRALLERARHDGAVVFVCEKDLKAERLQPADLLPGIVSVDASDVWVNGAPTQADAKLRRLCS
jgi:intracellular sulfur oxidation DsrE/DsrF family protein